MPIIMQKDSGCMQGNMGGGGGDTRDGGGDGTGDSLSKKGNGL